MLDGAVLDVNLGHLRPADLWHNNPNQEIWAPGKPG
ncbi:hypothetical protein FHS87_004208 [Roseomonas pecuniae]|uniref:Uncharacterized protein n=1 Tax=Muricoccus pecuniae TaxID=693023 RepID=A0A840Y4T9_9PROT|nr:hypothetical protein [Roseomonas pecuniae]